VPKPTRWPKHDRIAWVEERLRDRFAARDGRLDGHELDARGVPDQMSLEVWLAKERDGLSWQQIVIKYFPRYIKERQKAAGMSKARRVHMLVNRALEPPPKQSFHDYLGEQIREIFGCTPEEFKAYLDSIRTEKPK
jgi:hypothetical protein